MENREIIEKLIEKGIVVATAESCTGGMISSTITDVSGSSAIFGYGMVTYSNEAKMKILGVKEDTLKQFGAVSNETAYEMAKGLMFLVRMLPYRLPALPAPVAEVQKNRLVLFIWVLPQKKGFIQRKIYLAAIVMRFVSRQYIPL